MESHRTAAPLSRRTLLALAASLGTITASGLILRGATSPAVAQAQLGPQLSLDEFMKTGELPENITGKADAPVTMTEYASMTCPHCARFHTSVLDKIKEKYIDTGKVRLIMREFPLDNLATAAAMLPRCAGPDKHFAFSKLLYAQQEKWAFSNGNPVPPLRELAKQAGFTRESFDKCLKDQKLVDGILWIRKRGSEKFSVNATPTLFLNGRKYNGALNVAGLSEAIDALLESG